MPTERLNIPEKSWEALKKLAAITGVDQRDPLPKLIQDALRVYEWVLFQQVQKGRTIAALERNDVEALTTSTTVRGDREFLKPLFSEGKAEEARQYFVKAA